MPVTELDRIWTQIVRMTDFSARVQYIEYVVKHQHNLGKRLTEADFEALERGRQMIKTHIKEEEYENAFEAGPWC